MSKKIITLLVFILGIPAIIFSCSKLITSKQYYVASALIIALALAALFLSLEKKKMKTRELVAIACVVALAIVGRAALFMFPQIKLTCAIVILAAISFGPYVGFLCGSLSMFISNIFFGQGAYTPFQMFGMGLAAFLCGLIFYKKSYGRNRWTVAIIGGILCFAVYGFIVDSSSALFFSAAPTIKTMLPVYISGLSFNAIHAVTTLVALFVATPYIQDTFDRIAKKYGLFGA